LENTNNPITLKNITQSNKREKSKGVAVFRNNVKIGEFQSQIEAANYTGVSVMSVSLCARGKYKQTKGYKFKRL
jgi:hypothetical protein